MTSAERRDLAAMSAGDEQEAERHAVVPMPRKSAASADAVGEWEAKWTRSPCPSVASPVPSSPVVDAIERDGQPKEQTGTHVLVGSVPTPGSQLEEALPVVGAIEQFGQSEE